MTSENKVVSGYVVPVPTINKEKYKAFSQKLADYITTQCGAESVVEAWGYDVPEGKVTSFPMAVKLKEDETVVFSWATWSSKQARDEGLKKIEQYFQDNQSEQMPFDGMRMIFGSFEVIANA